MDKKNLRFQLYSNKCYVDSARTRSGAFTKAIFVAKSEGIRVLVHDRFAHTGDIELWEFRPFEKFARIVHSKRRRIAA